MSTALFQTDFFQNAGNGIADCRGRSQGQVHDSERHAQHGSRFGTHQLTDTGNLKCCFLNSFCHFVQRSVVRKVVQHGPNHARAGYAHAEDGIRFAHAVECTGHERVILYRVAEYHQLCSAHALVVFGEERSFLNLPAHQGNGVHVDAGLGGADVYRGAHQLSFGQSLRDGFNQFPVAGAEALLDQCGISADKINSDSMGCPIQRTCVFHRVAAGYTGQHGNRCNGNSLVYNWNAVLSGNLFAGFHQVFCFSADLFVDLLAGAVDVAVRTVQQRDAHGGGTDIQVFVSNHGNGFQDIANIVIHACSPFC